MSMASCIPRQTHGIPEGSFREELERMMKIYRTDRTVIRPAQLLQDQENKLLEISPKFQRRSVWKLPARSFFIDTLLRGMPVPPIYLRALPPKKGQTKMVNEVVDGQQRIRTILEFIEGHFRLSKGLDHPWGGKRFSDLSEKDQQQILMYAIPAEVFETISDADVLGVFARLNTHGVPLNKQELRNGRFFGTFKRVSYSLAYEHLKFWEGNRVFTDQAIARMLEVQLTSELLIAGHAGMQDKKTDIDNFYRDWEDEYPNSQREQIRFKQVLDEISECFTGGLRESEFSRPPIFYTLYCTIFHHLFKLPGINLATPKKPLSIAERADLRDAATALSEALSDARGKEGKVAAKYAKFINACLSQTDNIGPRKVRFEFLWKTAF